MLKWIKPLILISVLILLAMPVSGITWTRGTTFYDLLYWKFSDNSSLVLFDTNVSTICGGQSDTFLNDAGNCQGVNATIDARTVAKTYLSFTTTTILGTFDSGNDSSVHFIDDGDAYNVSENAGANALEIEINYTDVNSIDEILLNIWYEGGFGHEIAIELFHWVDNDWESFGDLTDTMGYVELVLNVLDPSNHINDGNVSLRFRHVQNGNANHDFSIDYAALNEGPTTLSVNQHDGTLGRDSITNHPWAIDAKGRQNATKPINLTVGSTIGDDMLLGSTAINGTVGIYNDTQTF